ncbi:MAG: OmpA-OmpF porin, OOP family [Candidatus Magnetoglobus multicellularis str. Araruama]|uniref:OmpA-OmpF porin, OOP family n=1 Tax=Candidatus Magnetoglobus multicellularis str. Araruama TaxID=890399 RepID=A0A1V1PA21_9BACT|nr:MAG: OmpA-OmpF porin, OOP family [Candidatus Magnetoglobus multicellularis str. Araruama]
MNERIINSLIVGCMILFVSVSCAYGGDEASSNISLSPFAGGYLFEGQQTFGGNAVYGLNLGYQFSNHWAARIGGAYGEFQHAQMNEQTFSENLNDVDAMIGYLDLMFIYPIFNNLEPYILLGGGDLYLDLVDKDQNHFPFVKYGAGLTIKVTDNMGLWGEFTHNVIHEDQEVVGGSGDEYRNNAMYVAGFSLYLDTSKGVAYDRSPRQKRYQAAMPNVPRDDILYDINGNPWDSDGDGVNEQKDQCAGTPSNVPVDANGCPHDKDHDGVFDYKDHCKNTERYVTVDKFGCPKDSDSDGVYDMEDHCQDTPNQAIVDLKGCPMDSDADGVYDGMDQCPKTMKGMQVDAKGCPRLEKTITFSLNITFKVNSAEVDSQYFGELKKLATMMKQYPKTRVVIEAHTDNIGSKMANLKLSQKRADSVRHF